MNSPKQLQHEATTWDKSEDVYKLHPASPSAPNVSLSDDDLAKHVPMALAVPVDHSPTTAGRSQFPRPVASSQPTPWVLQIPILMVFHLGNFVLAVTAFTLVVTFFSLSIGLLPLCCFGVIIFQMLAWMTEYFAKFDIALANLIIASDTNEKLRVHHRITSGFTAPDRNSLVSEMTFVSSRSFGAMVYFMTIKFAVGILSCIVAICVLALPVCPIALAVGGSHSQFAGLAFADHPVGYVVSAIGVFVAGLWLLPIVASLSRKLTEVSCAEKAQHVEPGGC